MTEPYDIKFQELKNYIPFLEEKIEHLKKIKLKFNYPDPARENILKLLQTIHKILINKEGKRLKIETLLEFEKKLKKLVEQDYTERHAKNENINRRDYNPLYNAETHRPSSSCSTTSGSSAAVMASPSVRPKKVLEDCPASPSPPGSPTMHSRTVTGPIIIPTDRHIDSPPRSKTTYSPTPPVIPIPNIIPITRVNVKEQGPKEWDSDNEDESATSRPKIIIPTASILKKSSSLPKREDMPNRWEPDLDKKRLHPSENIPMIQVNALEGSRRLSTVLEKSKVFSDVDRLLNPHGPLSPLTNVPEVGLRSPDSDLFGRQTPSQTFPRGDLPNIPRTPSLLLNAPITNARPPIAIDDIAEYLDDNDCNNLRNREQTAKHSSAVPRPISRMGPDLLSSRSDKNISPLVDPRLASDPRSRLSNVDPRSQGSTIPNDPRAISVNDPRTMPINDPRSMSVNDPRSAISRFPTDTLERLSRPVAPPDMIPQSPGEFQRSRLHDQYCQDSSVMGMSPMHGIPGPGPPSGYSVNQMSQQINQMNQMNQQMNQMNQINQMNYDYRRGPNHSAPQQWSNVPPGMMQSTPQPVPPPSNPYNTGPLGPGMRPSVPDQSGWQKPGIHMMNGDNRMPPSYQNQMSNMPRPNAPHVPSLMSMGGTYNQQNKYPSYPSDRTSYNMPYDQQQSSNDFRRPGWNGPSQHGAPGDPRNFNRSYHDRSTTGPQNAWNNKVDVPNRGPNRDPRIQQRSDGPHQRPSSPPKVTAPQPGKEVHPNKFNKPSLPEKDSDAKKRLEKMRLDILKKKEKKDLGKVKERSKDSDRSRDKPRDSDKEKDKKKGKDKSSKSPWAHLYGTIDAKKAVQGTGLNKFKIPKKRPSIEAQPEQSDSPEPNIEEETWDDENVEVPTTIEPTKKTKDKTVEKNKKKKQKEKTKGDSTEVQKLKQQLVAVRKLIKSQGNTDPTVMSMLSEIMNQLNDEESKDKKGKKAVIYSSDEDKIESSDDDDEPSTSSSKSKTKKKKKPISLPIEDSSPDESPEPTEKEIPKIIKHRKLGSELKVSLGKLNVNELKKKGKLKSITLSEKEGTPVSEKENESESNTDPASVLDAVISNAEVSKEVATPPVKPKPKRRNRELDVLHDDLKSSWMCEALEKPTTVRSCSQKNKMQEQTDTQEEAGKAKRIPGPKSKTKAKKPAAEMPTRNSGSEEDESAAAKPKKGPNRKTKAKSNLKICPPPLFDDSSNDEFNLDASAVEPSSDISLHPESNDRTGKTKKKAVDEEVESSSDESFVSNSSSSLLLDSTSKPRDINEELLEDVMHQLSTNPKYTRAKKKQIKKKRSGWQNGVLSKTKRKKKQNKNDETSTQSTSVANEDVSNKENDSSLSDKKPNLRLSTDSLDESRFANNQDEEDITPRVDPDALIEYTLSDGNEKKQCLLCPTYSKKIVHHYKTSHPRKEVLISRLPIENSRLAIEESKLMDLENNSAPPDVNEQDNFTCRFCSFFTQGLSNHARESFYEHLTTHTGEYRFKCLTCGYDTGSKNSIKSHYYTVCKKRSTAKNVNDAFSEDAIPNESRICGYLCSKCHFLQLKKENVERHVAMWHKQCTTEVSIIKIDMSLKIKNEIAVKKEDTLLETKDEKFEVDSKDNVFEEKDPLKCDAVDTKDDVTVKIASIAQKESEISVLLEVNEHKPDKKDNLSAFVCASGVDEKELEIQNERKKKMEEIAANIGIKSKNNATPNRLSIIDRLKNKISLPEEDEIDDQGTADPLKTENKNDVVVTTANEVEETIKADPEMVEQSEDASGSKLTDPLAFAECTKPDVEHSDSPMVPPVQYDSDSSAGSDHDENTDVSSILQKSDTPAPADRMLDTIQRLAAQIHNNKQPAIDTSSLPEPHPETIEADTPVKIKTEKLSPDEDSFNLLVTPTKIKREVKNEPLSPPSQIKADEDVRQDDDATSNSQSPQKFIRIRRISGDKLSKGGDQEPNDENEQTSPNTSTESANPGFLKIENVMSLADSGNQKIPLLPKAESTSPKSMKAMSILKPNQQYIIQRPDGTIVTSQGSAPVMSSIASDAVKIYPLNLPTTTRSQVPNHENVISIAGQQALSIKIDGKGFNMVPTSSGSMSTSSSPVKYIKLVSPEFEVSTPSVITAVKLKSAIVYEQMLKDEKLIHLYKCMGRDCSFTTNVENNFQKHLKVHEDDLILMNKNLDGPKDYLKCAYCYVDFKSHKDLLVHLRNMHTFCRYCCKYCFYRAFAQSYVELHQKSIHPMKKQLILVVSEPLVHMPPQSKRLDRKMIIKPYVCEHDCNKYFFIPEAFTLHLNMHHPNLKNSYKCHTCKKLIPSVEELIAHYKSHGFFKYHCLYCIYGAPKMSDMHSHLSTAHYNQPPEILERCLPREISKNLSAIEQLKIHDVDQLYLQKKTSSEEESLKVAIPPLTKINNDAFLPLANLDSTSNIRILGSRSLNPSSLGNVINVGNNVQITVQAPNNALTNFNNESKSLLAQGTSSSKGNVAEDSDSDIEIIEEKSTVPSNANKNKESAANQIKEETPDESPLILANDSTSSSQPEVNSTPSRFLTLDDVKDTGFVGRDLFRCGTLNCTYSADSKDELQIHMKQCAPTGEEECADTISALHCPHCAKKFGKVNFFMDHIKTHGLKRFKCGMCESKFALQSQAQTHIRIKHKHNSSKAVAADPTNPIVDGLFIVYPMSNAEKTKNKKLAAKSPEKSSVDLEKTEFYPNEIEKLPLQSIFIRDVKCKVCSYKNKVRSNMIRHLQAHLNDEKVPDSSPVNPVPCLDKKERMFDKMYNLASSSHENGRMGGGMKEKDKDKIEEDDGLPKFVPEHKRYVCGLPDCNYLTVEETMLRHHIKALHSEQANYKCPHCTNTSANNQDQSIVPLDKMGNHFKMHDCRLFKCSYCIYYHYQRHVVERHLLDKHSDKPSFVKVIRDLQTPDSQPSTSVTQEAEEIEQPDPDGNTWKCCLCDFKSVYKQAMQNHALSVHGEKNQFQCHCGYKAISKVTFDQHLQQKHPGDPNVDYLLVYKRIKSLKKIETATDPLIPQGEPFDTTPLWRRGGIRHIRGILVEEEEEATKSPAKRKLDVRNKESKFDNKKIKLGEDPLKTENDYGPFGNPFKDMFACPSCPFKSKNKADFKEHLNRELKYYKWLCPLCDYTGVNRRIIVKHCGRTHPTETNCDPIEAPSDDKIEKWILETIIHQSEIIKGTKKPVESEDEDVSIELKDEEFNGEVDEDKASYELLPEPLKCKHCTESFVKWRGFKRHVQLMHLKRLGFCCPYCDQSTNSEVRMMQHVRTKHAGMPEKVIENQNTRTDDLTDEFWEREYGLIIPKRPKKRKRKDDENTLSRVEIEHPCDQCDHVSTTSADLKNHLKTHEMKIRRQCVYCSFQTYNSSEIRHHWEVNHLHREFQIEEAYVTPAAMEVANRQTLKKFKSEDEKKSTVYYCYYCNMGSIKLEKVRSHWKGNHKNDARTTFKYKEHSENIVRCAYCAEAGTMAMLANHIKQTHGMSKETLLVEKEEDGWLCKYANENRCKEEFIFNKEEMDDHHRTFHPLLPLNFQLTHRTFTCKECNMDIPTVELVQKHAKIHLNAYKCKHCSKNFKSFAIVKQHFALSHPEFEPETRTINSDDLNKEIDEIVEKCSVYSDLHLSPVTVSAPIFKSPPTSPRIAKKSTTKQSVSPRRLIKPCPLKIRAVARKSTNPLPRYPEGTYFEIDEQEDYVSYYKKPFQSVDLSKIHIEMAVGGFKKKINCSILGTFGINIDARPRIEDCMKKMSE